MNLFEPTHLLILGIVVLVLFGPKKIPEFMRGLGQGMGELKKGLDEGKKQLASAMEATETSSSATSTPAASPVAGAVASTDTSHTFIPHDAGAKASDSTVHATSEPIK